MNKHFSNENAGGAVSILLILIAYIFIVSIVTSFFLVSIYGTELAGIDLPSQNDVKTYASEQNFANGTYDLKTISKEIGSKWDYISGVGLVLTQLSRHTFSYVVIDYLQKDSQGLYQNSYWVNNSPINIWGKHNDYCIVLRFTGGIDQNEVCVREDGFHIPVYLVDANTVIGDKYFLAYPDANQVVNPAIKTIYNDKILLLDFYFEGEKIFTTTQLNEENNLFGLWGRYYAGVASWTVGFGLQEFQTESPIISGLGVANGDNILSMLVTMFTTIIKISTWSIPAWVLPHELVLIFISLPEAAIVVTIAIIVIRGVG